LTIAVGCQNQLCFANAGYEILCFYGGDKQLRNDAEHDNSSKVGPYEASLVNSLVEWATISDDDDVHHASWMLDV